MMIGAAAPTISVGYRPLDVRLSEPTQQLQLRPVKRPKVGDDPATPALPPWPAEERMQASGVDPQMSVEELERRWLQIPHARFLLKCQDRSLRAVS
jgi:hypothetical protein